MKRVRIVGIGMGPDTVTGEGMAALRSAELLLGAPRLLADFAGLGKPMAAEYAPARVAEQVRGTAAAEIAVLVSGDVGFFSAARGLTQALDFCRVELVPGVSSLHYFFARLGRPWQEAAVLSCHGREAPLVETVRRNGETFVLTGGNLPDLGGALTEAGFGTLTVQVGEDLGRATERIRTCRAQDLAGLTTGSLTVLLVENPAPDSRCPTGLPDEAFLRGQVPMTKAEVRAVILSKLALRPEAVCADIGAGTGSVTVEMALSAWRGRVYAVERGQEGVDLIRENCRRFHVGNVTTLHGTAPAALEDLPPLDAAFLGGTGGQLGAILDAVLAKNPAARVVVSAIALETVQQAMEAFAAHGLEPEIVQVAVARTRPAGGLHLLMAQNPIFLLCGGGSR